MIREALAGQRIAITGATGFLGTALVERLLRSVPDCELVLLVRGGRRTTPATRAKREIFGNDAFRRLRAELGDRFDAEIARRVQVVAGDVSVDGLGLDDDGPGPVRQLRHRHPLRGPGQLRLPPRRGRRGQPARARSGCCRRC